MGKLVKHNELKVYQRAMEAAMSIFEVSKSFPKEETYSLTESDAPFLAVRLREPR